MFISVVSSQSSQLGSYISISHLLRRNSIPLFFGWVFILFFRFPTRTCSAKELFVDYASLKSYNKIICADFYVDHILLKLFFSFVYVISAIFSRFFQRFILLEPRPYWAFQALFGFPLLKRLPLFFRNIYLSGDGFLALTLASSPPWLSVSIPSHDQSFNKYLANVRRCFYLYSTSPLPSDVSKLNKLKASDVKLDLEYYYNNFYHSIFERVNKNLKSRHFLKTAHSKILIFPLTTFSETGRCSLHDEINMYILYLKSIFCNPEFSNYQLLIKPHPGQSPSKSSMLLAKVRPNSFINIHPLSFSDHSLFGSIPLEILLVHLFEKRSSEIAIIAASTAAVSASLIFTEQTSFISAFGYDFLSGVLKVECLNSRLNQEKLIRKLISPLHSVC